MENNQRNSRKRLNSLILLVAFTAVMLIVSTYAWFSTQKNVLIKGLTGEVKVAEGMQISLDATKWTSTIDLSQVDIVTDAYKNVTTAGGDTFTNTNLDVDEMLPVSTTGADRAVTDLVMYRGNNTETDDLDSIIAVKNSTVVASGGQDDPSKADYPGYFAFDLFIQNSGLKSGETEGTTVESLQLDSTSSVTVKASGGNAATGLQNTPRVAFAKFSGSVGLSTSDYTAGAVGIIPKTNASTSKITDVAIWEPNADKHVQAILDSNNSIKWSEGDHTKYAIEGERDEGTGFAKFKNGEILPTYALTSAAASAASLKMTDIYNWTGAADTPVEEGYLAQQNVVATPEPSEGNPQKVYYLKSTKLVEADGDDVVDDTVDFEIPKNSVVKLRVYVWLEGQDVDCINYASHGGGVTVNIGLVKGTTESSLLGNASEPTSANSAYVPPVGG